jgi:hypothetical protein
LNAEENVGKRDTELLAIGTGAAAYVILFIIRSVCQRHFAQLFSNHWFGVLDTSLVFSMTLASGWMAGMRYPRRVLWVGFWAASTGEAVHGAIKLFMAIHAAGVASLFSLPLNAVLDVFVNAVPSGVPGAAGGAVALVRNLRPQSKNGG